MSVAGDGFSAAVIVVSVDSESFTFWNPRLSEEVDVPVARNGPLCVGDWIFVDYSQDGSVAGYEKIEGAPYETSLENGELVVRLHAFIPREEFAVEHNCEMYLLSTNLGRLSVQKASPELLSFVSENRGKGFAIKVIGTMNLTERDDHGKTMWIVDEVVKRKKITKSEKDTFAMWFEKSSEASRDAPECEDTGAQYASIQKFQKKLDPSPSASSFERLSNVSAVTPSSASSFSVVSAQRSPDDSAHSVVEDHDRTLEATLEVEDVQQSQGSSTRAEELELLALIRDLINDDDFEAVANDTYPIDWIPLCRTFGNYYHLLPN